MFNLWLRELPSAIELSAVQLPGRESRIGEPNITRMSDLIAELVDGLSGVTHGAYALYGHSIGALIAFELSRELRRRGKPLPIHLFVSARRAPQCPPVPPTHHLGDKEFLADITKRYGEIPSAILSEPEVLSVYLRILRADVALMDTYRYDDEPPLTVPVTAYGGIQDRTVTQSMLEAWRVHTSSTFRLQMFDGGHFFPDALRTQLIRTIVEDLGRVVT